MMKQRLAALLLALLLVLTALPAKSLAVEPTLGPDNTAELLPEPADDPESTTPPEPAGDPESTTTPGPHKTVEPAPEPEAGGGPAGQPATAQGAESGTAGTTIASGTCGDAIQWKLDDQGRLVVCGTGAISESRGESDSPWASLRGQITELTIEPGVTHIGAWSFSGCTKLHTVVLPASVASVGSNAFSDCAALAQVYYAGTETAWGRVRIDGGNASLQSAQKSFGTETPPAAPEENIVAEGACGGRVFWKLNDRGVLTVYGEGDFWGVPEEEAEIYGWDAPWFDKLRDQVRVAIVESGVTSIGARAFMDCQNLTQVQIADSVTAIGNYAFTMCYGLKDITLPDGVEWIGTGAFGGCLNLERIHLSASLKTIGKKGFCDCEHLMEVELPEGLTVVGDYAFERCILLTRITIPDSVTTLGTDAFHDCNALRTVTFGTGIDRIPAHTFHHCDELQSVTIPQSVTLIEKYAFDDCFALTDVYYAGTAQAWQWVSIRDFNEPLWNVRVHYGTESSPLAGYPLEFDIRGVPGETAVVWVDGVPYAAGTAGGRARLMLPDTKAASAVIYSYNGEYERDRLYPTGMTVWLLEYRADGYRAVRRAELDNILQYKGCSIRITGRRGIRMITGVPTKLRNRLIGEGIHGWKLAEYGTVVAWADDVEGGALVLGAPCAKSAAAYRAGVSDPIFRQAGGLTQYTNVLVGYTNEQCAQEMAMRPYLILKGEGGKTVTLYGGVVCRSIAYIALQNRNAFKPGTAAYRYISDILEAASGKKPAGQDEGKGAAE